MTENKNAATLEDAAKTDSERQSSGNDAEAQRLRVLDFLRKHGSLSTFDARHRIDVMHPAARVMELRRTGYEIMTVWAVERTPEGRKHRIARYHLVRESGAC